MNILDTYYKKTIAYKYKDTTFNFAVSQSLFSSHDVDFGTRRLLRTLIDTQHNFDSILDLGCGYGPIGITLKAINSNSKVHMIDRDALALEFSKLNAKLNNVGDIQVYGSLGYDNVTVNDFDLIISNIPAKVGRKVLSHMLIDANNFLRKDGLVAVVVTDEIIEDVEKILSHSKVNIVFKKSWPGHTVFHFKFWPTSSIDKSRVESFSSGLYERTETSFNFLGKTLTLKTTHNLPEFDEMSFKTQLLMKHLNNLRIQNIGKCLLFNVNQGHIPVAVSLLENTKNITMIDRNLQSLKTSERNLILNNYPKDKIAIKHQADIGLKRGKFNFIAGILDEKVERTANLFLVNQIINQLETNGSAILVSSSNLITQLVNIVKKTKEVNIKSRIKYRGESLLIFKKVINK